MSKNMKDVVVKAVCKPYQSFFIKEARLLLKIFSDGINFRSSGSEFQRAIADLVNVLGGKGQALSEKLTSDPLRLYESTPETSWKF